MPIVSLADGRAVDTTKLPEGHRVRYGRIWKPGVTLQMIELTAFSLDLQPPFGLGRFQHYKRFHEATWPEREWNPWTELKMRAACENNILGAMGCSSCAKSDDFAHLALTFWWAAPQDTVCVIVSTTLESARARIWAHLRTAHMRAKWYADDTGHNFGTPPGKITEHPSPKLRLTVDRGGVDGSDNQAILVVPAGAATDRAVAITKLQGIHNKRVLVFYDEAQSLGLGVVTEALPNLFNNEESWVFAFGNFDSPADALGIFCKPTFESGYNAIGQATKTWPLALEGRPGVCLRIDGRDTPNRESYLKDGTERYPYLLKYSRLLEMEAAVKNDPTNPFAISALYRQGYALPRPEGVDDTPFNYRALEAFGAMKPVRWASEGAFKRVCGVDPAFTADGDEFAVCFVGYGKAIVEIPDPDKPGELKEVEKWVIALLEYLSLTMPTGSTELRGPTLAKQLKDACLNRGVQCEDVAVDCTGANSFGDILADVWQNEFLRSTWGGSPSDLPASQHDLRKCKDVYDRRASELWFAAAEFMRNYQIRGLKPEFTDAMSKRRATLEGRGGKISVESKKVFKGSFGRSPDAPDSLALGVEVCRVKLGAVAGGEAVAARREAWNKVAEKNVLTVPRLRAHRGIAQFRR